jgi:PRTRC genetic system protein A
MNKEEFKNQFFESNNDFIILDSEEKFSSLVVSKFNTWVVDKKGTYLTVKNRVGEFTAQIEKKDNLGLLSLMEEKYKMYLPKVPESIYYQIQSLFIDIADEMGNAEAYVQVYYDIEKKEYFVFVPEQIVSGASVHYNNKEGPNVENPERYIYALEIHSHNTMNAFFSGTDDADEKETRFYGVFGKIKDATPEFKLRFVVHGQKLLVNTDDVFDFKSSKASYPEKWKENIKRHVTALKRSSAYEDYINSTECMDEQSEWSFEERMKYYKNKYDFNNTSFSPSTPNFKKELSSSVMKKYDNGIPLKIREKINIWESETKGVGVESTSNMRALVSVSETPQKEIFDQRRYNFEQYEDERLHGEYGIERDSEEKLQDAFEEIGDASRLDERWMIIGDFVEALRPQDLDSLCEHLVTYGAADEVLEKLKQAA